MANQLEPILTGELFHLLQKECFVTLSTIDYETDGPYVSAISWVYALNEEVIHFAVDNRSRIIKNIRANSNVTLTLIGDESTFAINGTAEVVVDNAHDVPIKLAIVKVAINEVCDIMFYGAKISQAPKYEKIYDSRAAAKLDKQVMDALRKA
jgi:uncharacterized pyridoxamine 5'-phosphate oxidase family protein